MDRDFILEEIRRLAACNNGKPPGKKSFLKATGIKESDWSGKYWARWGDAVSEAGFSPNVKQVPYDPEFIASKLVLLIRELGRFPTVAEISLRARSDKSFPSESTIGKRLGGRSDRASFVVRYCKKAGGMDDVIQICLPNIEPASLSSDPIENDETATGYVYLLKSGKHYKIGSTRNPDRRQYEIGLRLPEKIHHFHSIETDDPSGIEAYWHNRFREKRLQGEWFALDANDIRVFRRRKFM